MPSAGPASPPLRRDAQRNLERILDAAREAFAEDGIEVGVDEIARRAGVGVGTLYRRFPTKEALIDAIVDRRADEIAALADEAAAQEGPWECLVFLLGGLLERHARDRGFKALIADRMAATGQPTLRERLRPQLEMIVGRAQEAGALRDDLTIEDLTVLLWGAGRAVEITGDIAPDYWQRHLGILLDSLRAPRATPLAVPPLTETQGDALTAAWAASCRSGR
ncbi:MAG: TetR/AcrR family transcriptional regulator [Solirubrobacteraceae bacterium]